MPFTIPNKLAASFADQAKLDSVDLDALTAGMQRTGVISGCGVSAQGTPNMTVAVAAGLAVVAGQIVTVTAGNVTGFTADATNPRFAIVTVDSSGTKTRTDGTPHATAPSFPTIPANSAILAAIYIPAGDTAINSNQINDKRIIVSAHGMYLATKTSDTTVSSNTVTAGTDQTLWSVTVPGGVLAAGDRVWISVHGNFLINIISNNQLNIAFGATALGGTNRSFSSASANRREWGGYIELIARSTTSQSLAMNIPFVAAGTTSTGAMDSSFVGSGLTSEDTSADKVLELRARFDVQSASAEAVISAGIAMIYKATG